MTNKLNKVIILGTAHPFRGGLAAYNERLAKAFSDRGINTEIVTFTTQYPSFLFPGKTQFTDQPSPTGYKITRLLSSINPFSWIKTGFYIRKQKPDLIITKYWLPFMGPAFGTVAAIAGFRRETIRLSILDNVIPHEHRPGDKFFTKYFIHFTDAFIAMSDSVLHDLKTFTKRKPALFNPHPLYDHYGNPKSKEDACKIIGVDPNFNYLLFFGFIRDYKGLDILLDAMAMVGPKNPKLKLIVAGEFYNNSEPYLQQINNLQIEDYIVLKTDFISDDKVADYFSAADVIVQPYKTATQSGVTQIAYHFEKPMIVTNVGGLPEIVPHMKTGLVSEPNSKAIASAINTFYDLPSNYFEKGLAEEKKKYSWDRMLDSILSIILQLNKSKNEQ